MSIYSSLYSGVSGLTALSNSMSVIGDNIANVNTTGFKSSKASFEDVLSMTVTTGNGTAQVGQGTNLTDVSSSFSQAGFETSDSVTDMAIDGDGFFILRNGTQNLYTRAGAFHVDSDLNLVSPGDLVVQGTQLDLDGNSVGSTTDIRLDQTTIAPSSTSKITTITNLNSDTVAKAAGNLSDSWDGEAATGIYIDEDQYSHSATVKVYDEKGEDHDITMYFSKSDAEGDNTWEFIVTCDPSEQQNGPGGADQGRLGVGNIVFNDNGSISSIEMTEGGTLEGTGSDSYWTTSVDFLGGTDTSMDIDLDFGAAYNSALTEGEQWVSDTLTSTQYYSSSVNIFQATDGFPRGELQDLSIGTDGKIRGNYSNGESIPLYQLTLAKFSNVQGLEKFGGSLFRESTESGLPTENAPETNGLGKISSSALEQSNVDIAVEFVKMITTQRGFQANSKTIMTTDQMIQTVVNLKR
ncbi:Flagellar hook protein FlgE [Candidatus Magnetomoraceae bacterium gMMP-15]